MGDLSSRVIEKNTERKYLTTLTNSAEFGIVNQQDFFDKDITNLENIDTYYIVKNNDFIYNPRISNFAPVGPINRNKLGYTGVVSPLYNVFRTKNINILYLEFYFKTSYWHRFIKMNGDSGARSDRISIRILDFERMPIPCPIQEEQTKIGLFLDKLNTTIALHQRKLEHLELLKKEYLQQIFPVNENDIPQLRFSEFSNAWKQRKLGDIGKVQSGIGFPDAEQGGTEGLPFYKVSDMNNAGNEHEMTNANNYVNDEQIQRKKWKPIETVPALIFAKVGAAIMLNRKRLVRESFLIDNNMMAYVFAESWDTDFGKTLFETINLPRYAQVGALPSYNGSDIESISVSVPHKDEQRKIGEFFRGFDNLITLHQLKLDKALSLKQAYLQKMFI